MLPILCISRRERTFGEGVLKRGERNQGTEEQVSRQESEQLKAKEKKKKQNYSPGILTLKQTFKILHINSSGEKAPCVILLPLNLAPVLNRSEIARYRFHEIYESI